MAVLDAKGRDVVTIPANAPVLLALQEMESWDIGALVVTQHGREVVGVISEREIARGILHHGCHLLSLRAREIMSTPVPVCRPDDSTNGCLATMIWSGHRHLPVVGPRGPCGIVTVGDLLRYGVGDAAGATGREAAVAGTLR